ncbi:uncharacterized protein LOC114129765 isoform X1 [Aphis gossypii]|nr:uncharacterized protein LOC114129765 isoform X1 [Aphis gossypii]
MSSNGNAETIIVTGNSATIADSEENNATMNESSSNSTSANTGVSSTTPEIKTQDMCIAEGCNNLAIQHAEWDNEYCSVSCTYKHCKATFKAWLENNKTSKPKSVPAPVTQVNVVNKQVKEEPETNSTTT